MKVAAESHAMPTLAVIAWRFCYKVASIQNIGLLGNGRVSIIWTKSKSMK